MARNFHNNGSQDSSIKSIQVVNSGNTPITISEVNLDKTILFTQRGRSSYDTVSVYLSNSTTLSGKDADNIMGTSANAVITIVEYN